MWPFKAREPLPIARLPHQITPTIICREALVIFARLRRDQAPQPEKFADSVQRHVDDLIRDEDLDMCLDEFSQRFIQPLVEILAASFRPGADIRGELMQVPAGVEGAAELYGGVAMRVVLGDKIAASSLGFDMRLRIDVWLNDPCKVAV